uniref:PX domain-containing protein n=1 Tax=Meleagris gallopavo TaxID=9103 RepID=A0A803Y988_MELGA
MSDAFLSDCCHLSYGKKIHQRITESLRIEKTSKFNKSNCQPIAIMHTTYIAYKLVPSHTGQQVHRRYKHFDWLYGRLAEKFPVISVPHLPEKQATGRFEEDFISKRRKGLAWWMDHMCSHPVLAQCDAFQHFLTCPSTDEKLHKLVMCRQI